MSSISVSSVLSTEGLSLLSISCHDAFMWATHDVSTV